MSSGDKTTLAEGRFVRLVKLDPGGWEYVERVNASGVVVIIALTHEQRVVLVEQHRPPIGARVIELPAGLAGDVSGEEDEPLARAAARELEEETGYRPGSVTTLFAGPPSAGLSDETVTFVRARELERVGPGGGDESEDITVHEVAHDEVHAWLAERSAAGALIDPKVYAGLYWLTHDF
ncbi:MAG: NUDIX hydrolase [Myxococcales bacterium]|nr:NUDIX hydrolase [Myxococcales bacterium]